MSKFILGLFFVIVLSLLYSCKKLRENTYLERWNNFETQLINKEKSFQSYEKFDSINGVIRYVTFQSGSYTLKGLLNTKNIDSDTKKPAIIYLHGGFALSLKEMERTKQFTDAGFIVFAPSYRGENGNPGYFELFMGEVRDAKAAINWLSNQQYVDKDQIYTFGWSVGGGISLILSQHEDVPIKLGGSSAGVYDLDLIKSWATEDDMIIFPYDYKNEMENYYRLPIYTLDNMVRPHYTYIGKDDGYSFVQDLKDSLYPNINTKLQLIPLDGNHVSSLNLAVAAFLKKIQNE